MENSLAFACQQTFFNTDNSLGLYYILQVLLIAFYIVIMIRSIVLFWQIRGRTELGKNRKNLLWIIAGVCILFVFAELLMIFRIESLFVWFFFDLSMGLVYTSFISLIKKDNHD